MNRKILHREILPPPTPTPILPSVALSMPPDEDSIIIDPGDELPPGVGLGKGAADGGPGYGWGNLGDLGRGFGGGGTGGGGGFNPGAPKGAPGGGQGSQNTSGSQGGSSLDYGKQIEN